MANAAAYRDAGARAEHRGRLRRPARPRLCGVLRDRRLHLRHPHRFQMQPAWSAFWEPFAAARPGRKMPGEPATSGAFHRSRSGSRCRSRRLLAAFFGVLFGAPTLRLRGDYLAIVTLGFGEIVPIVVRNWSDADQRRGGAERRRRAEPVRLRASASSATPYYYVAIAHGGAADLRLASGCATRASAAPGWRSARTRSPPRAMGVDRTQVQAAGLRHRRRVRRHDRRVLCRQAADRDAGDVRLSGLGDDPGDGRARRHRQRLGRGARRGHAAAAAVLVAAGPDRVAARARPARRQRLAAARRSGAVDRADLRHHPRRDDAVPARGADPGDAAAAGADASSSSTPRCGAAASRI